MMALWDRLRTETKAAAPGQSSAATSRAIAPAGRAGSWGPSFLPMDNVEATVEGHYKRCLWVFRCVDAIAQAETSIPIYAWESHDDGAMRVEGYESVETLLNGPQRPNRYEEYWQFRYRVSSLLLLSTRGVFVEVVPDADTGEPAEFHILDTDAVTVHKHPTKYVDHYSVRAVSENGKVEEKKLDPDRVLWLRARPHPKDQYAQVTPLQAAGLSADTDFLARMFNANWLKNDGRPGLLIGVSNKDGGGFSPDDLDTLKNRFGAGVRRAGETSVIEADTVSVNDLASTPKDAQYSDLLSGSKLEIMSAFGVSEPFIAWAANRTYENASTEIEVTWENTMRWHCKAVASGFMPLVRKVKRADTDETVFAHDFSKVRFLQRGARENAAELRAEYSAGLITLDEYREGTGKKALKVPGSQVMWVNTALTPVGPDDKTTQAALELQRASKPTPVLPPGADPAAALPPSEDEAGQLPAGSGGRAPAALPPGQPGTAGQPASQQELAQLRQALRSVINDREAEKVRSSLAGMGQAKARLASAPERKTAGRPRRVRSRRVSRPPSGRGDDIVDAEVVAQEWHDPVDDLMEGVEADLTKALGGVCRRMLGAVDGRLSGTKARKGTRHWTPDAEEKREYKPRSQLSEFYIAQIERWAAETRTDAMLTVRAGASRAMADLREPSGIDGPGIVRASKQVQQLVNRLVADLEKGMNRRVRDIQRIIRRMDDAGASIQEIKDKVAAEQARLDDWVARVAPRVAQAAVNGARKAIIDQVPDSHGVAVWTTRGDHRVRDSHVAADGQVAQRGKRFVVGGVRMAFPGDTRAPAHLWANCRCRVTLRRADGREF